jgi:hypothetical protein
MDAVSSAWGVTVRARRGAADQVALHRDQRILMYWQSRMGGVIEMTYATGTVASTVAARLTGHSPSCVRSTANQPPPN